MLNLICAEFIVAVAILRVPGLKKGLTLSRRLVLLFKTLHHIIHKHPIYYMPFIFIPTSDFPPLLSANLRSRLYGDVPMMLCT